MSVERFNLTSPISWKLAEQSMGSGSGPAGPRRFAMLAYTGSVFDVGFGPAVIDLVGLALPRSAPVLRQHDPNQFVGRADRLDVKAEGLVVEGFLFDTDEGQKVARMSDQGAEWQASVGVSFSHDDVEFVERGAKLEVNGKTLEGPFIAIRKASLREVSFVPVGADPNTSAITLSAEFTARLYDRQIQEGRMADPVKSERQPASVKDLRAAFPDDPTFALDAAERGLTLLEAKAEYGDKLAVKLTAERKRREELEAKLAKAERFSPAGAISAGTGSIETPADPIEAWNTALAAECDRLTKLGSLGLQRQGITVTREANVRGQAVANLAARHPDMHRAYLEAYNARRAPRQGR